MAIGSEPSGQPDERCGRRSRAQRDGEREQRRCAGGPRSAQIDEDDRERRHARLGLVDRTRRVVMSWPYTVAKPTTGEDHGEHAVDDQRVERPQPLELPLEPVHQSNVPNPAGPAHPSGDGPARHPPRCTSHGRATNRLRADDIARPKGGSWRHPTPFDTGDPHAMTSTTHPAPSADGTDASLRQLDPHRPPASSTPSRSTAAARARSAPSTACPSSSPPVASPRSWARRAPASRR